MLQPACAAVQSAPAPASSAAARRSVPANTQTLIHDQQKHFQRGETQNATLDAVNGFTLRPRQGSDASFTSPVLSLAAPFNELILSWNIHCPAASGFRVEARVRRTSSDAWSPWLFFGDWGDAPPAGEREISFESGKIEVDILRARERFEAVQYRIRAATTQPHAETTKSSAALYVERIALCASDSISEPTGHAAPRATPNPAERLPGATGDWKRRLPVPFRSQKTDDPQFSGRLCSPTSLAMVMAFHGQERETLDVARATFDPHHQIYGNWPRNIQAAYALGVPGYITRVTIWAEAEHFIARGLPLVASIRVDQPGGLAGAPYSATDGHLIVVTGFEPDGRVAVNDPAGGDAIRGQLSYSRADMEKAWFAGSGGVTYVLLPPRRAR